MAPILMLHKKRDTRYERPCALSKHLRILSRERGCVLAPSYGRARPGRGLLVREVSPTGAPRPSCCCAPLGALVPRGSAGAPVGAPEALGQLVTADCLTGAALLAAQQAGHARCACGFARCTPRVTGAEEFAPGLSRK
jgi:hypothetical protein